MQPASGCMMISVACFLLLGADRGYNGMGIPSWPTCSFTDLCVVYNSPVTSIIDSPGIVAYLLATYVGTASKESSEAMAWYI